MIEDGGVKIDLPYVLRDKDRYGKVRLYFRRRAGTAKIRLPDDTSSREFTEAYHAALARYPAIVDEKPAEAKPPKPTKNTFRWLCQKYYASQKFAVLDTATQNNRQRILNLCCDEPTTPGAKTLFGEMPLQYFGPKAVRVLRDRKEATPEAANGRLKAMRPMFRWAIEKELADLTSNPVRDVDKIENRSTGYHTWTMEEVRQFEARHPIGTKARLALALLLYLGQRRSDVVSLGRQHVKGDELHFTQHKNRNRKPIRLILPIVPALRDIIDQSPTGDLTFLVTEYGKPFSMAGFGNRFREWCNEASLHHCSSHGLRKARATWLADFGCTAHEIMSITGHQTIAEVERYTKAADQKRLARAAMKKVAEG